MDARTFVRSLLPAVLGLGLALALTRCQALDAPASTSRVPASVSTTAPGVHA